MYDVSRPLGVTAAAPTFAAAYQRLLDDLEQALWYDDSGNVVGAYEEFTEAYAEALADPAVYQRVSGALQRLSDALADSLQREGARARADEAARHYLRSIGEAWPDLTPEAESLEALMAVATGMTTLAWIYGLGASGLLAPFGSPGLFGSAAPTDSWTAGPGQGNGASAGSAWGSGNGGSAAEAPVADPAPAADDDGIVWQEFTVGEDGEIVQRTVTPAAEQAPAPPPRRQAPAGGEPVERVERAYAAYVEGLRAAGAPVSMPPAGEPPAQSDLEQRTTELASAYLRLTQGLGSLPELVFAYARFLGSSTGLIERELALVRAYERLLEAASQGRRPAQVRHAVDGHYRRFVDTVREAWADLDPGQVPPERLASLAEVTAQAARLYESATGGAQYPFLR
jgi:hypothetical protein